MSFPKNGGWRTDLDESSRKSRQYLRSFFLDADYYLPDRIVMGYYNATYYSMDGGNTFQQVHTATNPGAGEHITDVLWNGNIIYIGMIDGVLQSTNNGNTFSMLSSTGIPSGDKLLSFASGKESNNLRFYALCANAADVYTGITFGDNYNGIPKAI